MPRDRGGHPAVLGRDSHARHSTELYGLDRAIGLPGFEGAVGTSGHGLTGEYVAAICSSSMSQIPSRTHHSSEVLPAVETALRRMVEHLTPANPDLDRRCLVLDRLRGLAQTGISFCLGLDLEPYGSFVSGLYTPLGDLDLSIEGTAVWTLDDGRTFKVQVHEMQRKMQEDFLRALAGRISKGRLARGRVERILHARVPILKFVEAQSGLECDVGISAGNALFKSTVLGLLAQYEWRVGAMVRLVKAWARRHNINDSTAGTLNSFALTLMVIFHLQTRSPPVVPPLCEFLAGPYSQDAPRPMEDGGPPDFQLLKEGSIYLGNLSREGGHGNAETLLELLSSFFSFGAALCGTRAWGHPQQPVARVLRRARLDTWAGQIRDGEWEKNGYFCSIEDPFDRSDNCARTVRREEDFARIAQAFSKGEAALSRLSTSQEAEAALGALFGADMVRASGLRLLAGDPHPPPVQWVPPTDLVLPPRLRQLLVGCLPRAVRVNHRAARAAAPHPPRAFPSPPPAPSAAAAGAPPALGLPAAHEGAAGVRPGCGEGEEEEGVALALRQLDLGDGVDPSLLAPQDGGPHQTSSLARLWQGLAPLIAAENARQATADAKAERLVAARLAKRAEQREAKAEARAAAKAARRGAAAALARPGSADTGGGGGERGEGVSSVGEAPGGQQQRRVRVVEVARRKGGGQRVTEGRGEARPQEGGAAAGEGGSEAEAGGAAREAPQGGGQSRPTFGAVMKLLAAAGGDEAAWEAAFAALPPPATLVLHRKGVTTYQQFQEAQDRHARRARQGPPRRAAPAGRAPHIVVLPAGA